MPTQLRIQISDLKELISKKETELAAALAEAQQQQQQQESNSVDASSSSTVAAELKAENENLKSQIAKLSDLVQIGNHSYHEENKKVQELECTISCLNGKEGTTTATTNGN